MSASIVGTTSGPLTGSTIALPAGCAAGDLAVVSVERYSSATITPPAGAFDLVADYNFFTNFFAHVYGYVLTSADITNGYIGFAASSSLNWTNLSVLRGVDSTADAVGAVATPPVQNTEPLNIPANSVTTTAADDLVLAIAFVHQQAAVSVGWTTPSGFTPVDAPTTASAHLVAVYSDTQSTAGATTAASIHAVSTANLQAAGVQIAFKAAAVASSTGSGSLSQGDQAIAASASAALGASGAASQAAQAASASGAVAVGAAAAIAPAGDTVAATAAAAVAGTLDDAQAPQSIAATGQHGSDNSGSLNVAQAGQSVAGVGAIKLQAQASIAASSDSATAAGAVAISASADVAQSADAAHAAGVASSGAHGIGAATQGADSTSARAAVAAHAAAAIDQDDQLLAAVGTVGTLLTAPADIAIVADDAVVVIDDGSVGIVIEPEGASLIVDESGTIGIAA